MTCQEDHGKLHSSPLGKLDLGISSSALVPPSISSRARRKSDSLDYGSRPFRLGGSLMKSRDDSLAIQDELIDEDDDTGMSV